MYTTAIILFCLSVFSPRSLLLLPWFPSTITDQIKLTVKGGLVFSLTSMNYLPSQYSHSLLNGNEQRVIRNWTQRWTGRALSVLGRHCSPVSAVRYVEPHLWTCWRDRTASWDSSHRLKDLAACLEQQTEHLKTVFYIFFFHTWPRHGIWFWHCRRWLNSWQHWLQAVPSHHSWQRYS